MTNKANSVAATDNNSNSDAITDSNSSTSPTAPTKDDVKRKPALDSIVANAEQRSLEQSAKHRPKPSGTDGGQIHDAHPGRPLGTYRTEPEPDR